MSPDHVAAPSADNTLVGVGRVAKIDAQLPIEVQLGVQFIGDQVEDPLQKCNGLVMRLLPMMLLIERLTSLSG